MENVSPAYINYFRHNLFMVFFFEAKVIINKT